MTRRSFTAGIVAPVLIGCGGLYLVGWQLSRPVPDVIGPPPAELQAAPITFDSESGSGIRGWLSRGTTSRGVVLLLPGIRANRLTMVERALFLRAAGYSTLLIDFQAIGRAPATPSRSDGVNASTSSRRSTP